MRFAALQKACSLSSFAYIELPLILCHKTGLQRTRRGEICRIVQSRASLAIEKELTEKYNIGTHTPVTDDVVERFMSEGCWERFEDFIKVENIPSNGQAALVKKLSVTQVLR
jgi:hypothetical protein